MPRQYYQGSLEHRFVLAASTGNTLEVAQLIDKVADVNAEAALWEGCAPASALYWASRCSHTNVMKLLLTHEDIDKNARRSSDGWTPLMTACITGRVAAVTLLLTQGVDATYKDKKGKDALHYILYASASSIRDIPGSRVCLLRELINHYPLEGICSALARVRASGDADLTRLAYELCKIRVPTLQALCRNITLQYVARENLHELPPLPPVVMTSLKEEAWAMEEKG
ncbi:unnamed protein product [Meganyctiphanes norvegica]|uniref:SOCS box domain-containing protein n=1 Tax=Meganyctiphanes norvegica TaxID=48144 RepID=A0AAV2QKV9_MEGNR